MFHHRISSSIMFGCIFHMLVKSKKQSNALLRNNTYQVGSLCNPLNMMLLHCGLRQSLKKCKALLPSLYLCNTMHNWRCYMSAVNFYCRWINLTLVRRNEVTFELLEPLMHFMAPWPCPILSEGLAHHQYHSQLTSHITSWQACSVA